MTWLAVWLIGVGVADVVRAADQQRMHDVAPWVGAATVLVVGRLSGLTSAADLVALLASLAPLVAWVLLSQRALEEGSGHLWPLGAFGGAAVLLVALSGWSSPAGGVLTQWLRWADLPPADSSSVPRLLLVVGLGLVNLATANVVVRLVLVATGALRPTNQRTGVAEPDEPAVRLKGGRLLGPMERIVIFGLGLAGQLTAASIVVAAKGLIRFPELQSATSSGDTIEGKGIDEVTEYFLVGSFVSWLFALASLALLG